MQDVGFLKATSFLWNDPVEYNDYFTLYPVYLRDYIHLMYALDALQIIKEDYADTQDVMYNMRVVQMSNLEFLVDQMTKKDASGEYTDLALKRMEQFRLIFKLCFHIDIIKYEYFRDENKKMFIVVNDKIFLNHTDFDELRKLICFQHIPDYDDTYISKDLREEMRRADELRSAKINMPTLEDRVTSYCAHFNLQRKDLSDVSVREFISHELMYKSIEEYKHLRVAELGGMVEFKKPIEHYLFKAKKSKMDGYLVDFDAFESKISQAGSSSVKK